MIFVVRGVKIRLSFSFAAVVTLTMLLADTPTALVSLLSSVAHETGHLVCLFLCGGRATSVELGAFGMRLTRDEEYLLDYKRELLVLLSGVFVNLTLGTLMLLLSFRFDLLCLKIGWAVNFIIGGFNLLPFQALDGGRALCVFLLLRQGERRSKKFVSICSHFTVAFLCVVGVYLFLIDRLNKIGRAHV